MADGPLASEPRVEELAAALTRQNPNPVSVSPSGELVLVKSMRRTDFELAIRRGEVVVARHRSRDSQLAPTWRFDDGALAFLADDRGDQRHRLFVLDVASGRARAIEQAPPSEATALRWEPRGTRVAYLVAERGRRERALAVVDTAASAPPVIALAGLHERAGFVWSPDGAWLAGISQARPGSIALGRADGGATRSLEVAPDAELRSLAWSADGTHLLATLRRAADEYVTLVELSAATGRIEREVRADGDITGPLYLPGGGIAYHVNRDGEVGVQVVRDGTPRRLGPDDGTSVITGFAPDGTTAWILHTGRTRPPELLAVALTAPFPSLTIHAAHAEAARGAVVADRIDLVARDGRAVPSYLVRAVGPAVGAVVRVHGGPAGQAMRSWDPAIQWLASHGVHVLSVNYRGSTGYGAALERAPVHGDAERVAEVLAARDYAERVLGVPAERIALVGHSYGALLVAEAARRAPRGPVVLLSFIGPEGPPSTAHAIAFHGERDVALAPAAARHRVLARFPGATFVELPGEGHTFRAVATWARVYATVLAMID